MSFTDNQIKRVQQDWQRMSGEPIEIQVIKDVIYGFCSELGTLRLLKKYRKNENARSGYSEILKKHYFVLETNL